VCRLVYPGDPKPTRAQLGSVGRALKRMALPGKWTSGYVEGDRRVWLYNGRNLASVSRRMWRFETFVIDVDGELLTELPPEPVD
jgi:hypothetical protein